MAREDTRVRMTKIIIKDTFISLLRECPLNKITVTQICKNAEINRVTFYKYYSDTFDLYEKLIDEMIEQTNDSVRTEYAKNRDLKQTIEFALTDISHKFETYSVLFSENIDTFHLSRSVNKCVSNLASVELEGFPIPNDHLPLLQAYLSFGSVGFLTACMKNVNQKSTEEIAEILYLYISQILKLYKAKSQLFF